MKQQQQQQHFVARQWRLILLFCLLVSGLPVLLALLSGTLTGGGRGGRGASAASYYGTGQVEYALPANGVCSAVDLVYLWVDGSDPQIGRDIARITGQPYVETGRLRDIPTLRYSIRAADTFAPWIRRVVLVTNGQVPAWLNASSPRVRVVPHARFFHAPNETLPTFNSNAIEAQLPRLAASGELAPCWFYQNDDFSFGRPVSLRDFLDVRTGRQHLAFDSWAAPEREHMKRNIWHRSVGNSNALLNKWYHPQDAARRHNYEGHNTRLFQSAILETMYGRWQEEFDRTARHRFRQEDDIALPFLYNNVALEEGLGVGSSRLREAFMYSTFTNDAKAIRRILQRFRDKKPISFCLNDGAGTVSTAEQKKKYNDAVEALVSFFEEWFPLPSDIELVAPGTRTISRAPPQQPLSNASVSSSTAAAVQAPLPWPLRFFVVLYVAAVCYVLYVLVSRWFSRDKSRLHLSDGNERDLDV